MKRLQQWSNMSEVGKINDKPCYCILDQFQGPDGPYGKTSHERVAVTEKSEQVLNPLVVEEKPA